LKRRGQLVVFEQIGLAICRFRAALARLGRDERGVTAVEYGVLAALILVACLAGISSAGTGILTNYYQPVASSVTAAVTR